MTTETQSLVLITNHAPHPLTGGTYTVVLPPADNRSTPITFTVTGEELYALLSELHQLPEFGGERYEDTEPADEEE